MRRSSKGAPRRAFWPLWLWSFVDREKPVIRDFLPSNQFLHTKAKCFDSVLAAFQRGEPLSSSQPANCLFIRVYNLPFVHTCVAAARQYSKIYLLAPHVDGLFRFREKKTRARVLSGPLWNQSNRFPCHRNGLGERRMTHPPRVDWK